MRRLPLNLCCVAVALVGGCSSAPPPSVAVPEQLTLYSIDPTSFEPAKEWETETTFRGYRVLGKINVTDQAGRKEIMTALVMGMARKDVGMAACFFPRHAIRTTDKGRAIDYVICFQCQQVKI